MKNCFTVSKNTIVTQIICILVILPNLSILKPAKENLVLQMSFLSPMPTGHFQYLPVKDGFKGILPKQKPSYLSFSSSI